MKNKFKFFATSIVFGFFIFIAGASGDDNKYGDQINPHLPKEEIKEAIMGKWSSNENHGGFLVQFRFEITDDKIKVWRIGNELNWGEIDSDWKNNPDEVVNYSIGDITDTENGGRQIIIAEGESFGKLVIKVYEDSEMGTFKQVYGYEENSMFNDWKH